MKDTISTKKEAASCPYAAALHFDDSDGDESTDTAKLIHSCPAFESGSCPFAGCTDEDAVRKALLQIPPSHFSAEAGAGGKQFLAVLQELHNTVTAADNSSVDSKFHLTACPVASMVHVVPNTTTPSTTASAPVLNFTQAMDGYSLAAIMARMAEEMEAEEHATAATKNSAAARLTKEEAVTGDVKELAATAKVVPHDAQPVTGMKRVSSNLLLSESFKTGTAVSHQAAEDVHFVRNFIRGQIDRKLYAELVVQLYHVYDTLEGCLVRAADADHSLQQFRDFHQQLQRKETLKEDLDFWHGPVVTAQIVATGANLSPAASDYVERLKHCAATDPLLLLAHSYTRYLGDLSGGKILARVARKAMGLDKNEGLAFYDFVDIPSAKKFKDAYRTALDSLELTDSDITKLVAEANVAFLLNMRLFEELDVAANVPGATVRPLAEALAYASAEALSNQEQAHEIVTMNDAGGKPKECPFAKLGGESESKKIPEECPFAQAATSSNGPGKKNGRCPWPFILAHDPVAALQDWQTWALVGLVMCYVWSKLVQ